MIKVFIDGAGGTTGLQLEDKLLQLQGIEILKPSAELRKDLDERRRLINSSDVTFLCLPDAAAVEAVALCDNPDVVIIDASTAHRTAQGWAYGLPELSPSHLHAVSTSNRIAVPGCHASGFCALVYPLVSGGILPKNAQLNCFSLTGYSGGGKAMIAEYEGDNAPRGARPYALGLVHKHLPEMTAVCRLDAPPIFLPVIVPVRQGMLVSVPLAMDAKMLWNHLSEHYADCDDITVVPFGGGDLLEASRLECEALNGTNKMEIFVFGHDTQAILTARFDNLGKGASGAALQCMNIRMNIGV